MSLRIHEAASRMQEFLAAAAPDLKIETSLASAGSGQPSVEMSGYADGTGRKPVLSVKAQYQNGIFYADRIEVVAERRGQSLGRHALGAIFIGAAAANCPDLRVSTVGAEGYTHAKAGFFSDPMYRDCDKRFSVLQQNLTFLEHWLPSAVLKPAHSIIGGMADHPGSFHELAGLEARLEIAALIESSEFTTALGRGRTTPKGAPGRIAATIAGANPGTVPALGNLLLNASNWRGYARLDDPQQRGLIERSLSLPLGILAVQPT